MTSRGGAQWNVSKCWHGLEAELKHAGFSTRAPQHHGELRGIA